MDQAARGTTALSASNYAEAVKEFTGALAVHPESPDYYIKRATAYQRLSPPDLDAALRDAELAVIFARKRAKYELVTAAQMRRAITLFHLGRYADAEFVLGVVKSRNAKENSLAVWEKKAQDKLKALPEGDEGRVVSVKEVPEVKLPAKESVKKVEKKEEPVVQKDPGAQEQKQPAVVQTPPSQIKQDWYQSNDNVTITLLAKGVPKDKITVDIQERSLSISFPTITSSTYDYSLEPLYLPIDPTKSSYKVLSTKVEVILKKAAAGKWKTLEADPATIKQPTESTKTPDEAVKAAVLSSTTETSAPSYPTSSKSGPKNWDTMTFDEKDLEEEETADPNFFFKKLYEGADPDTKRAMMKSYVESNGTSLSTNWEDVKKAPVETHPPEGMEARKWGS